MYKLLLLVWGLVLGIAAGGGGGDHLVISKSGCKRSCVNSDVLIPYPFGIGRGCYDKSSEHYEIICKPSSSNSSSSPPKGGFNNNNNNNNNNNSNSNPFLRKLDIQVFGIGFEFDNNGNSRRNPGYIGSNTMRVEALGKVLCNNDTSSSSIVKQSLIGSPFTLYVNNRLIVEGCGGRVNIRDRKRSLLGGCSLYCDSTTNNNNNNNNNNNTGGDHSGPDQCGGFKTMIPGDYHDCCLITLPNDNYHQIELTNTSNNNNTNYNNCVNVTYLASPYEVAPSSTYRSSEPSQAVWQWEAPQIPIISGDDQIPQNRSMFCSYLGCVCISPFHGNPYLPYGCRAISGLSPGQKKAMILGLSISLGIISMSFILFGLFRVILRWRQTKRKSTNFKRNGGLLLQQQTTRGDNMVDTTRIFSDVELEKATDNFNANRILGKGGQGTVYKGMLLDGKVVAVKKALEVDESQIEQFINEVVILSEIRHRNIVKLLGCCLETEVPLLVYEFIPNGTLSQHIHNLSEEFYITWKMRLQIAAESAGALTYLHSASATPIYHRDIKSSNILLDEKFRAKVADFGTSRTFQIDQTHLTTLVQGTFGYLDPEYFQTNQFTEKSDVYSFGVVLVELLTSQKPLSAMPSGGWKSLTREFLLHMESSCLFDIVDSRILVEAKKEDLFTMANLAMNCLNLNGKHRPTMKEVANVLEGIKPTTLQIAGEQTYSKAKNETMEIDERVA